MANTRSDVKAKETFVNILGERGYTNIRITAAPADIQADKNGEHYFFEIKMTSKKGTYFGAATATEWEQAFKTPNNYKFVIAVNDGNNEFSYTELSPNELMEYSTIPPFCSGRAKLTTSSRIKRTNCSRLISATMWLNQLKPC